MAIFVNKLTPAGLIHLGCSYRSFLVTLIDPLLDVVKTTDGNWRHSDNFKQHKQWQNAKIG